MFDKFMHYMYIHLPLASRALNLPGNEKPLTTDQAFLPFYEEFKYGNLILIYAS